VELKLWPFWSRKGGKGARPRRRRPRRRVLGPLLRQVRGEQQPGARRGVLRRAGVQRRGGPPRRRQEGRVQAGQIIPLAGGRCAAGVPPGDRARLPNHRGNGVLVVDAASSLFPSHVTVRGGCCVMVAGERSR
jgi:hypothetical protein